MECRTLRADEIECRVGSISAKGCTILLYKDARCDMNLLDEIVGSENWQRNHEVINGNLYCSVGIKFGDSWVWKQDVGKQSNTEAEKGEASDAFKRACVNWGIGRELYTSPFIYIGADKVQISEERGKAALKDKIFVESIEYDEHRNICELSLKNGRGTIVYQFSSRKAITSPPQKKTPPSKMEKKPKEPDAREKLIAFVKRHEFDEEKINKICVHYKVESLEKMSIQYCEHYIAELEKRGGNINE